MESERIKEIQRTTAYPESTSVKQALLQVWNECGHEAKKDAIEFAEWLRTFEPLEKKNGFWILESQISSEELYNSYLRDREHWRNNKEK